MELQTLAAIAEITGVIMIVITLLFLGLQIRQANKATVATLFQSIADSEIAISAQFVRYSEVWDKVLTNKPFGDSIEQRRTIIMMNLYMTHTENRFRQHKLGYLDSDTWESSREAIRIIANLEIYEPWSHAPGYFNRTLEFRNFLDSLRG